MNVYTIDDVELDKHFSPHVFRNEYTLTLSTVQGLVPGKYSLFVVNDAGDGSIQALRVGYKICPTIRAQNIETFEKLQGSTGAEEFAFFRCVINDPNKLITLLVRPVSDGQGIMFFWLYI